MLLIGILAGVTLVERVWRYTKGALSPKMQFKEVKGMIEEEIKAGKELRGVIGDIDKQIQTLKKEIQKDWMEFDKTKTREGKIAILNRIKEKERWLEYLETIAKQRR
jgi:DNA-binding ferritin-like protein (Dps family)